MYKNEAYYLLKKLIPRQLQLSIRKFIVQWKLSKYGDIWPIDESAAKPPEGWSGWPEGKKFALVITHDVESAKGLKKCRQLAEIDKRFGFRSSFNFVAEDYEVPPELRQYLADKGFEVGIHGLHHDKNLFRSKKIFQKQAQQINLYLKKWNVRGFRTPSMYRDLDMIHDLDIDYDASTFDTDPFEPQHDGAGTIFPFWVHGNSKNEGYIELPYTLPQDFLLYILMKEKNINIWQTKLDWIAKNGGMALFIVHPDYINFDDTKPGYDEYPLKYYEDFLLYIQSKYKNQYWNALPRDIAHYWKTLENREGAFYSINPEATLKAFKNPHLHINSQEYNPVCNITAIDPEHDNRWDQFVLDHKNGSLYHHSLWKKLIQATYGYTPYYFVIEDENGQISAALPTFKVKSPFTGTRFVSLPFSDYIDPLVNSQSDLDRLINAVVVESMKHKATYIEFRTINCSDLLDKYISSNFLKSDLNRNHILDLETPNSVEELKRKFHKNHVVRNIKKALKSDLHVHTSQTEEDIRIFYELEVKTRRSHGLPPQPYDFFKNMWDIFSVRDMALVLTAYEGSIPVASIFNIIFKNTMYYLYSGSDPRYLRSRPNHLLLWKSIETAHRQGLKYFDFGRTSKDHESLIDFKRNWGTDEMRIYQFQLTQEKAPAFLLNRATSPITEILSKQTHRLPTTIHKLIGKLIYKHMG